MAGFNSPDDNSPFGTSEDLAIQSIPEPLDSTDGTTLDSMEIYRMTNDSQLIAQTFHEMRLFCRDIALLLKTGEEVFMRGGWKTQPDKACVYSGSYGSVQKFCNTASEEYAPQQ